MGICIQEPEGWASVAQHDSLNCCRERGGEKTPSQIFVDPAFNEPQREGFAVNWLSQKTLCSV